MHNIAVYRIRFKGYMYDTRGKAAPKGRVSYITVISQVTVLQLIYTPVNEMIKGMSTCC